MLPDYKVRVALSLSLSLSLSLCYLLVGRPAGGGGGGGWAREESASQCGDPQSVQWVQRWQRTRCQVRQRVRRDHRTTVSHLTSPSTIVSPWLELAVLSLSGSVSGQQLVAGEAGPGCCSDLSERERDGGAVCCPTICCHHSHSNTQIYYLSPHYHISYNRPLLFRITEILNLSWIGKMPPKLLQNPFKISP